MTSADADLQAAITSALVSDSALTLLLGGPSVYDQAPPRINLPMVMFARLNEFDWSTSTENGAEIHFAIEVWSDEKGKSEAMKIAARIREVIGSVTLSGADHRLVLLDFLSGEIDFDEPSAAFRNLLRFRALVEPAN